MQQQNIERLAKYVKENVSYQTEQHIQNMNKFVGEVSCAGPRDSQQPVTGFNGNELSA